jgi:acetoin utilization deacetylase AcuC-like enzyme
VPILPPLIISTDRFAEHQTPPGHPEAPSRAEVMDAVAAECRRRGVAVAAPRAATREQLARVHDNAHLARVAGTAGKAVVLDSDTYTSPESAEIALLAAGAAVDAVEAVMETSQTAALAMVRPPGHHAERNRSMGFCLYNNVAVAAAHARSLGADRVAIVDYDVHHGNGTQHIFERDAHVLYVSTHQYPFYPGTGAANEVGEGAGAGFTVNLPLEAGAVNEDYRIAFAEVVLPILRQFKPALILISAGFDAHERDPLGGMRLTTPAFTAMTLELAAVAAECCEGRIAAVTEGGYDLRALADCLRAVIGALSGDAGAGPEWPPPGSVAPSRGRTTLAAARKALSPFWRL